MTAIDGYLARLGFDRRPPPDLATLGELHVAHQRTIPFENAAVLRGDPIVLDPDLLVERLVGTRRGGFCYQLNGAFATLLGALGFEVELLAARFHGTAGLGRRASHLTLRVIVDGEPWLADVGAGRSFGAPLRLEPGRVQADPYGVFRIMPTEAPLAPDDPADALDVGWRHRDGTFLPHYRLEPEARALADFAAVFEWTRTSPESGFTRMWQCAVAREGGWATLDDRHLRVTGIGDPIDRYIDDDLDLADALERWFGIAPDAPDARMQGSSSLERI